ncbi:MAG: hypothetical protein GXY07_15360, partial [Candidatus Hydrogenedentes bacterium]|nr:hypothetical protein [Candidatus Hydrogenedentota bacterium]
ERDFVLKDPSLNLWAGIREDAKHYFSSNHIPWWKGLSEDPTGHMLSSQVACVNHLYYVRQRKDIATAILKFIDPTVEEALPVQTGYVEFEYIGTCQYLKEKAFTRGANCTSIDAVMLGMTSGKDRVLFLLEWKYTEFYEPKDLYIPRRSKVYDPLITSPEGPFVADLTPRSLYYEPFYQMMRQTLLAWQFEKHAELGCSRCINVHAIPEKNRNLKENITAPGLHGKTIHDAWRSILKIPQKYVAIDPYKLLKDSCDLPDTRSWIAYLKSRYW